MALIGAGISAAGSIARGAMGASAAGSAAAAQAAAAQKAADIIEKNQNKATDFIQSEYNDQNARQAPYVAAGQGAVKQLGDLLSPGGYLTQGFDEKFQAPTDVTEQNDPGYQFRLAEGEKALQRSASAMGNLLTGGTAKSLLRYGQNYASNEYGNVYNRALTEYQQRYNIFNNNQNNLYQRLAGLSGLGESATANVGQTGAQSASNMSQTLLTGAKYQGDAYQNQGAARASGYVGAANAWGGAVQGAASSFGDLLLANSLKPKPVSTSTVPGYDPSWTPGA